MKKRNRKEDVEYFLRNLVGGWVTDEDKDRALTELINRILTIEEELVKLKQEISNNKVISTYK